MTKTKQDNGVTDYIGVVYTETELNCQDLFNHVRFVTKIIYDNNVSGHKDVVYAENKTEWSWSIKSSAVYDED